MRCYSFCLGQSIDLHALQRHLKAEGEHFKHYGHEAAQWSHRDINGHVFVFTNGTAIMWNLSKRLCQLRLEQLKAFTLAPLPTVERDVFSYTLGDKTKMRPHDYFNVDLLQLAENEDELFLALSYALSQSVKLEMFENQIRNMVTDYSDVTQSFATHGRSKLSRRSILKSMGKIFQAKSNVNLKSDFLSTPKYFWFHPGFEKEFLYAQRYMDLPTRTESLNHKLDILGDIFELLSQENSHRASIFLEVIITLLITVEVVFNVLLLWH